MAPIGLNQDTSKGVAQGFRGSTWPRMFVDQKVLRAHGVEQTTCECFAKA